MISSHAMRSNLMHLCTT